MSGGRVADAVLRALEDRPGSLTASGRPVDLLAAQRAAGWAIRALDAVHKFGSVADWNRWDERGLDRLAQWAVRKVSE